MTSMLKYEEQMEVTEDKKDTHTDASYKANCDLNLANYNIRKEVYDEYGLSTEYADE